MPKSKLEGEFPDSRIEDGLRAGGVLIAQGKLGCFPFIGLLGHIGEAGTRGWPKERVFSLIEEGKKMVQMRSRQDNYPTN
ncbi:hypothetical protein HY440_00975 [Candidatus Microgenomates bacterium]|nr:hypothetical protein [Candidatus Microgenomates bacterium]